MEHLLRRVVNDQDRLDLAQVWQIVYNRDAPVDAPSILSGREYGVLATANGVLAGGYSVVHHDVTLRGGTVPCGGIGGVATLPEFRSTGVGTDLMRWSLAEMVESGFVLAALYPYRESYYRRFGYETSGRRWSIRCPQNRLPRLKAELPARKISVDELLALRPAYDAFAARLNGANHRTDAEWHHRMGKHAPMIWAVGDPVEAYAWTQMEGGFWEDLHLGELAWSTRRGYESLMVLLTGLCANRTALVWDEPSNGPFINEFLDQGVEVRLSRPAMFRLLDVPAAFAAFAPTWLPDGAFTFEVEDPTLPAVHGIWRVDASGGRLSATRISDAPDFRLRTQAFVQAILGEPSLLELAHAGIVDVLHPARFEQALRALPAHPALLTEFF